MSITKQTRNQLCNHKFIFLGSSNKCNLSWKRRVDC